MRSNSPEYVRTSWYAGPSLAPPFDATNALEAPEWGLADVTEAPDAYERVAPSASFTDWICRGVNVLVALVGLALTWPLMLIIALALTVTGSGPALYSQRRVGVDLRRGRDRRSGRRPDLAVFDVDGRRKQDTGGRLFTIYKFRTMIDRPGDNPEAWATLDDPRITPVGRVLRKTRLDELPQLWNVLMGDMNVVGPRPEQPGIFQEMRGQVVNYQRRQSVLPGITGWAQINQAYDQNLENVRDKVALDLEYIGRRSAANDLLIMARTLPVMLFRRGSL